MPYHHLGALAQPTLHFRMCVEIVYFFVLFFWERCTCTPQRAVETQWTSVCVCGSDGLARASQSQIETSANVMLRFFEDWNERRMRRGCLSEVVRSVRSKVFNYSCTSCKVRWSYRSAKRGWFVSLMRAEVSPYTTYSLLLASACSPPHLSPEHSVILAVLLLSGRTTFMVAQHTFIHQVITYPDRYPPPVAPNPNPFCPQKKIPFISLVQITERKPHDWRKE